MVHKTLKMAHCFPIKCAIVSVRFSRMYITASHMSDFGAKNDFFFQNNLITGNMTPIFISLFVSIPYHSAIHMPSFAEHNTCNAWVFIG